VEYASERLACIVCRTSRQHADTVMRCNSRRLCSLQAELPKQQPVRQPVSSKKAYVSKKHAGWSAVTAEERGIARPVSHYAPLGRRAADVSDTRAFPALASESSQASQQGSASAVNRSPWQSPDRPPARTRHTEQADESRWKSASPAEAAKSLQDGKGRVARSADSVQSLSVLHPWANTPLLQVLP